MVSTPSPPPAPDPVATANAQGAANINTAVAQSTLNDVNQVTPYGTIDYTKSGGYSSPGINGQGGTWVPQFTATTKLSPGMQALFDSNLANSQSSSGVEGKLLNNATAGLSKPLDLSYGATEANLNKFAANTLDPQWNQQQTQLNQQLADQGLTPGSDGWKYQQSQFGLNKSNAYDQMYSQNHQQAVSDITNQYNSPLNTLTALRSNSQVSQPGVGQLAPTAQSSIAPPNYQGIVEQNYQNQLQQYQSQLQSSNAALGGLFGIGGSLLQGGIGLLSDRRDKKDIQKLGKKEGVDMYAYRSKGDPSNTPKTVGPMAQDIEKQAPGSTVKVGGHMVTKPEAARRFGIGA
jgi:hypothetical protein